MMSKNKLVLHIEIEESLDKNESADITVLGDFKTEHILFEELAYYLAEEHRINRSSTNSNIDLLEKLEILCKKAREYCDPQNETYEDYYEVKAIQWNDKVFLENKEPLQMYDEIICLGTNLYLVRIEDKFGLISSKKQLLPVEFEKIDKLNENCFFSENENGVTIYNREGNVLLTGLQDAETHFNPFGDHKDYIWARKGGKWGLFDPYMKPLIPFRLDYDTCQILYAKNRDDLYIKVFKDGKCGLINGILNIVIVPLDNEIGDIYHNVMKEYVIVHKADEKEYNFSHGDVLNIEDQIRRQN